MGFTPRLGRLEAQVRSGVARPLLILAFGHHLVPNSSATDHRRSTTAVRRLCCGGGAIGRGAASAVRALERVEFGGEEGCRVLAGKLSGARASRATGGEAGCAECALPGRSARRRSGLDMDGEDAADRHPSICGRSLRSIFTISAWAEQTHVGRDHRAAHGVSSSRRPGLAEIPTSRSMSPRRAATTASNKCGVSEQAQADNTAQLILWASTATRWLKGMWLYRTQGQWKEPVGAGG